VAAAHMAERGLQAGDAETLIAAEVARFHERQRTVNVAHAIVSLQRQAEEIRQTELRRMQAKLGSLSAEQAAAVEALTRGLVNKFLHPPMQALKQAARENDSARVEALCGTWSLPTAGEKEAAPSPPVVEAGGAEGVVEKTESTHVNETSVVGGK